jgi:hypothetical protein
MTHPTTPVLPARHTRRARALGLVLALTALPASAPLLGCDTGVFAATTTIGAMRRASPGVQRMRDPEILEAAFPGSIQQMEGLLEIKPDDAVLRGMMGRSYASYGYGFLEARWEAAQLDDDATEEQIEHWRERASLAYQRGREVAIEGLDMINRDGGGLLAVQRTGLDPFNAHLARFNDRERDAPLLFWTAYNWVRWISLHRDDMGAIADLPYVIALAERVYQLDPGYMDHAPVALRAGLMAAAPPALGGRPQDARVELQRAIELTGRRNLMYLVTMAQMVAVPLQDRALFESMLQEAVAFDIDSFADQRIPNILAQRRARQLLDRVDDLFVPADEDDAGDDAGDETPSED